MKLKRLLALTLTTAMLLTTAACGNKDISWSAKLGDETASAGVYLMNVLSGLSTASMQAEDSQDFLKATIDGKTGVQYVLDYANKETQFQLVVDKKFKEMGLTITDAEKQKYESYAKDMYNSDPGLYKANGISQQSLIDYNRYSFQSYKVFNAIFAGEGERAASEQEMTDYFTENYYLAFVAPFLKVDMATGKALSEEELAKLESEAQAGLKSVLGGEKSMADLVFEIGYEMVDENGKEVERGEDSNYWMVVDKSSTMFPAFLIEHLSTAKVDEVNLIEDDTYKMIVQKLESKDAGSDLITYYYTQMLPTLKQDEYKAIVDEWIAQNPVEWNEDAIKTYTPEKVKKDTDNYGKKLMAQQSSRSSSNSESSSSEADNASSESAASSEGAEK